MPVVSQAGQWWLPCAVPDWDGVKPVVTVGV